MDPFIISHSPRASCYGSYLDVLLKPHALRDRLLESDLLWEVGAWPEEVCPWRWDLEGCVPLSGSSPPSLFSGCRDVSGFSSAMPLCHAVLPRSQQTAD